MKGTSDIEAQIRIAREDVNAANTMIRLREKELEVAKERVQQAYRDLHHRRQILNDLIMDRDGYDE